MASTLVDDPAILNVLVAPGGVVSDVYPRKGNEAVLGLNFFARGAGNQEAVEARDAGHLILGGPFPLVQGGQALVGRLPVYMDDGKGGKLFWGLVSVTLKFPQALNGAELDKLAELGLAYDILNAHWFFRLSPVKLWYQYPESWLYISLGVLVSFLLATLAQHNHDLRRIRGQLENMAYQDALTGLLNRRGLFEKLAELIKGNGGFCLYYLDLNEFKLFNDTYGHNVGDRVLQVFAEEVQNHMSFRHIFARVGGDEFIIIAQGSEREEKTEKFLGDIRAALRSRAVVDGDDIRISFSVGQAVYPRDGKDVDALIAHADGGMYKEKRART